MLHNNSGAPIGAAFLIRIERREGPVLDVPQRRRRPGDDAAAGGPSTESLADAVVKALVAEGLYEKEARAMVKTWESSWFGEEGTGTRLLYTLPRRVTDKLLPLRINPTPDETVRVLVGRIDMLTPEQEAKLVAMLPRADTPSAISREEAMEMKALGRFLSPAIERAGEVQRRKLIQALNAAAAGNGR